MQNTKILAIHWKGVNLCQVLLTRFMDGQTLDMEMPMDWNDFARCLQVWQGGTIIQTAFPNLNADQREFLMTGLTPEEWNDEDRIEQYL